MTHNEKKFWDILTNLFVGAEVKGKSGFINLMQAKQLYFKKVSTDLHKEIDKICGNNKDFKDEMYDKLYSFFHRYFSESGSIFYNYTPFFYKTYTNAYADQPINEIKNFTTDYEQIITDRQDTALFYKTQMLYYVKSDRIFKDLEITIEGKKFVFDVSEMEGKKANEKKSLIYDLTNFDSSTLTFKVFYKDGNKTTKIDAMAKELKKAKIDISEEQMTKALKIFEKQSNVDYFINKDAKKFLTEQLDLWIYQYMFSQEVDFTQERFKQIQDFKRISYTLIGFIAQFENELVKVWNKPRFVLNSNIVVTMDRLEAKGFDIEKLKNHPGYEAQKQEWEELGLSTSAGLVHNSCLPIDTKFFPDLKEKIESLFDEIDFDGLLIKSENYQALNTILPRFRNKIDLIYIDPPFNTGDDFDYIDRFQDSTWLSLMENRLELAKDMLSKRGTFYLHLDQNANHLGRLLMNKIFGKDNFLNEVIWCYKERETSTRFFNKKHDNLYFYAKNKDFNYTFNYEKIYEEYSTVTIKKFKYTDENGKKYRLRGKDGTNDPTIEDETTYRQYLNTEGGGVLPRDWFIMPILNQASSERHSSFDTQKSESLMKRFLLASSNDKNLIVDYHSGSGTTIATAHKLNRKWVGIEMGEHFYTVILPRMKKILGGFQSGISKEVKFQGGGLFKYYELEQYEQILGSSKYSDVPETWLSHLKEGETTDCFLFDERLSEVITTKGDQYTVDITKLYEGIDLKETLHNVYGQRVKKIENNTVTFDDNTKYPLLQLLKPLLVW